MVICDYHPGLKPEFSNLLAEYFRELDDTLPESVVRGAIETLILDEWSRNILHIAVAVDGAPMGFSIYQIDTPDSDWCKRPGWGCIREFYIRPQDRRQGCGTQLAAYCEQNLYKLGAAQLYLTADDAISFWTHCGYRPSGETGSNDLEILTKDCFSVPGTERTI